MRAIADTLMRKAFKEAQPCGLADGAEYSLKRRDLYIGQSRPPQPSLDLGGHRAVQAPATYQTPLSGRLSGRQPLLTDRTPSRSLFACPHTVWSRLAPCDEIVLGFRVCGRELIARQGGRCAMASCGLERLGVPGDDDHFFQNASLPRRRMGGTGCGVHITSPFICSAQNGRCDERLSQ